jgi:hypothetical protein
MAKEERSEIIKRVDEILAIGKSQSQSMGKLKTIVEKRKRPRC